MELNIVPLWSAGLSFGDAINRSNGYRLDPLHVQPGNAEVKFGVMLGSEGHPPRIWAGVRDSIVICDHGIGLGDRGVCRVSGGIWGQLIVVGYPVSVKVSSRAVIAGHTVFDHPIFFGTGREKHSDSNGDQVLHLTNVANTAP